MRCPQVGRITMDMSLVDVTALRGQVETGDEVVIIGRQGGGRDIRGRAGRQTRDHQL
jgi:alanine racemase